MDVIDIFYLSKKIKPLHHFLIEVPRQQQRGMVRWYRTFSRPEFKIGCLELDIYDKKLDPSEVVGYSEDEIKQFISGVVE